MKHFSLFSGIGGIDIAAEWAGFETVGQCEFADYPTKVLEKHWPDVPRWRDIRDVTAESVRERGITEVTLLSGGFPCQPHSLAGERKASGDDRDLWGEFARLIGEIKPRWVLAENVPGLLTSESGRFFGNILRDLASMGYRVGWGTVRASWVGAIHQRERIFIIAYTDSERLQRRSQARNTCSKRENDYKQFTGCNNGANWWAVEPGLGRMANGVPNKSHRLKCLGNAVVPQQVYPILQVISEMEAQNANTST